MRIKTEYQARKESNNKIQGKSLEGGDSVTNQVE